MANLDALKALHLSSAKQVGASDPSYSLAGRVLVMLGIRQENDLKAGLTRAPGMR